VAQTFVINLQGANDAPTAGDQTVRHAACETISIILAGSDPDAGCGASALAFTITTPPTKGTLGGTAPNLTYTPTAGGDDFFIYTVSDGTSTASGRVTVQGPGCNAPPVARIRLSPILDLGLDRPVVISCNTTNICVAADGSQSSDLESPNSALAFHWFIEPSLVPAASGEHATLCLDLGTQTITLAVTDPQGATGTEVLTVEVITAGEGIDELISRVNNSNIARNKRPYVANLKAAAASADRGQALAAQNQLKTFQDKVRSQVARTDPAEAAIWVAAAQVLIDALEPCAQPPAAP